MARYRVQGPDGKIHVFEGPDGASPADIEAFAAQQFGGQQPSARASAAPTNHYPQDDPGVWLSALIGAGRTTDQIVDGMKQLYYGGMSKMESPTLSSLVTGETPSQTRQRELAAEQAEKSRLYKPLQDAHPIATAVGEALPSLVVPVGGATTLGANVARLGAAGALPGALEYGSAGERAGRAVGGAAAGVVGGVLVPKVVSAAVGAVPAIGRTARALVEPLTQGGRQNIAGRTLNRAAGSDATAAAQRMAGATELVPGSLPTAGQVAENGGIAALERAAGAANPADFGARATDQAAARLRAVRSLAGDDAAMAGALEARAAASGPLYQQARAANYTVDPRLLDLLQRPDMKAAMVQAEKLAANEGRPFTFNVEPSNAFSGVGVSTPASQQITGNGLQDLKMAIDAMLKDPASGFAGAQGNSLRANRGRLLNWMESANPDFKAARTTHAAMSRPINQMQVGRYLEEKLTPALTDFGAIGQEAPAAFARALRDEAGTAVKATDFRGAGPLVDLLEQPQAQLLTNIAQDLARKVNAQNAGRGVGSDTFQKASMGNIAERSGAPGIVGGLLNAPGVSKVTKFLYREPDEQIQTLIGQALLDPRLGATLMQRSGAAPVPAVNPRQLLLRNPSRAAQVLGGVGGMAAGNLAAQ